MNSKTINHICPSFNNKIYQLLVEEQIKTGDTVRVFYFRQKKTGLPNGDKKYVDGVMPFSFLDRFFFYIKERKVQSAYDKLYKQVHFDLIHAHTLFTSGYIAYKKKKENGTPYVVAVRGTDVNLFFKKRIYLRRLGLRILSYADAIIFISQSHKEEVFRCFVPSKLRKRLNNKTHVVFNGIDEFWHNNCCLHNEPQKGIIKLVYYGDVDKNKNLLATVSACEQLIKMGNHVEYIVIGKVYDNSIFRIIQSKHFIKYQDFSPKEVIISVLRESDVFIMPSFSETFGLTYVEAMSQGVPVIYSEGQGFDGIFPEGHVGFHVNPRNPKMIADTVIRIIENYKAISYNCTVESKKFSWTEIASDYQKIYELIMERTHSGYEYSHYDKRED